ncbi:hypothetical protein FJZ21_02750 [Candidatus Pacearchaeota archaeon]|nr:hypothetical protein [Candidatus Pacearchaeota archaeon]
MVKNKKTILIISALSLVVLAFLVSATISTINPLSGTNHSSADLVLFNVTFVNNTDMLIFGTSQTNVNATFFTVSGSTRTVLTNSSQCSSAGGAAGTVNCWTSFNVSGVDGFFNITSTVYNSTAQFNSSVNISSVYFDSTRPTSEMANPIAGRNYSQVIVLNVSATDATIGIQSIFFNITNRSTGLQNSTNTATREGSTSSYSVTINTTGYPNGFYNITVYVNDSIGNSNNSAFSGTVGFDNILPFVDYTCDDYTVEEDEDMDCDCVSSDSFTGVASTSFQSSPSTSSVGNNFQLNCTVTDLAGNIARDTIYYNVSEDSGVTSSGSSSGSSSSGTTTSGNTTSSGSNITTQNSSSGIANQLQGNQGNQNESDFKINYWIVGAIIILAGLVVAIIVLIKKGIIQRILKFNK